MAMAGVFTQTDICNKKQVWEVPPEQAESPHDGALGVIRRCTQCILNTRCGRHTKENNGTQTFGDERSKV